MRENSWERKSKRKFDERKYLEKKQDVSAVHLAYGVEKN